MAFSQFFGRERAVSCVQSLRAMDIARNVMNCVGVLHAINWGANAGDDFACNTCASANGRCARHAPSSSDPCLLTRRERVPLHRHDIACNTATVQFYMVGPSDPISPFGLDPTVVSPAAKLVLGRFWSRFRQEKTQTFDGKPILSKVMPPASRDSGGCLQGLRRFD